MSLVMKLHNNAMHLLNKFRYFSLFLRKAYEKN